MGGPRLYDRDELVPQICERLSKGEALAVICRDIGISRRTVNYWREQDKEIAERFDAARDEGFDILAAECLQIADTTQQGEEIVEKNGHREVHHGDMLGHRKLRIETRLKLLSKWDPRRYGDKIQQEISGELTTRYKEMSDDELNAKIAAYLAANPEASA